MKGIQTKGEEIANAITHGLGAVLAAVALVFLIIVAAVKGTAWHVVSFSIFGATLLLLYIASTLYHSLTHDRAKFLFRKFDHMSIYLLIAGTYTPFCLTALHGWVGWTIFGVIWGCAIFGVVLKAFYTGKKEMLSTILYVVMGWMGMLAVKPLYDTLSTQSFIFLLLGGVFYTAGTLFFVRDNIRYFHGIWHLFVLAGSAAHFFSIVGLLV
ncbi:hemolysin III family protein [Fulvivirgaceae bacterium PWU5]|uniref:Hemolysin III family protein n=1 Tax=Dawidia cretensis TaxID=2782350 RepID=A0AAP2DZZ3_9BACT|nr:hemolysin III family protein [Dawidia cretensis]MBT1709383.1 hemolysin III family protein [Dawidia cretensis]